MNLYRRTLSFTTASRVKYLVIVLVLLSIYLTGKIFLHRKTPYFTIAGISSHFPNHSQWELPQPSPEELSQLRAFFNQKFTYLDCGGQSFVFLSEDGQTVLKLFRLNRRRLPTLIKILPLPPFLSAVRDKKAASWQKKLERDFTSYLMTYQRLRQESGLCYLHINQTDYLRQTVNIIDKIGITHILNLDDFAFLLQKKVLTTHEAITQDMANGNIEKAKHKIDALLDLTLLRYKKGIFDDDAFLVSNYGFDGEQAIFLDFGRFFDRQEYANPQVYRPDFELITERFKIWLQIEHPLLVNYLEEKKNAPQYFQ